MTSADMGLYVLSSQYSLEFCTVNKGGCTGSIRIGNHTLSCSVPQAVVSGARTQAAFGTGHQKRGKGPFQTIQRILMARSSSSVKRF